MGHDPGPFFTDSHRIKALQDAPGTGAGAADLPSLPDLVLGGFLTLCSCVLRTRGKRSAVVAAAAATAPTRLLTGMTGSHAAQVHLKITTACV